MWLSALPGAAFPGFLRLDLLFNLTKRHREKNKKIWLLIHSFAIILILFVACLPLLSVALAAEIANANGCQLDESSIHPCLANGRDMGETLYTMGMIGWFMLVTIPIGLGLVAVYILLVAGFYIVRRIVRSRAATGTN